MQHDGIKYCVTALIDLQGFSNHLEINENELRTNIGKEAVERLQTLADAMVLMRNESALCTFEYPRDYYSTRINDAIIVTMDLPSFLMPSLGDTIKRGISPNEVNEHFDLSLYDTAEQFSDAYKAKICEAVVDLAKFVGVISRIHCYISRKESLGCFPGAKTVVATGYRRRFFSGEQEDFLAANFSWSNAYLAGEKLHGPCFFADDNIVQLLCGHRFARNIVREACHLRRSIPFDPFGDCEDVLCGSEKRVNADPIEVTLFRKTFRFRELNARPLAYLQVIDRLSKYLHDEKEPKAPNLWLKIFNALKDETGAARPCLSSFIFDIGDDIRIFSEIVEGGESPIFEEQRKQNELTLLNGLTLAK